MDQENIIPIEKPKNNRRIRLIVTSFMLALLVTAAVIVLILLPKPEKIKKSDKVTEQKPITQVQNSPRFTSAAYSFKGSLPIKK